MFSENSFFAPVPLLIAAEGSGTTPGAEALSQLDAYGFDWEDLPEEKRAKARLKGIDDYDVSQSWDSHNWRESDLLGNAVKFSGRWVDIVKVIDGDIDGKSRWTPKGFQEKNPGAVESPTATLVTHRVGEILGLRKNWAKFKFDVSWAFFQSDATTKENLFLALPPELQVEPGTKLYRKLLREVPGTKGAPRAFYETFRRFLLELGFVQSKVDKCLYHLPGKMYLTIHVDDGEGREKLESTRFFEAAIRKRFALKEDGFSIIEMEQMWEYCGVENVETKEGTTQTQRKYVESKLEEIPLTKIRARQREAWITEDERSSIKTT